MLPKGVTCSQRLHLLDQKYCKTSNIVKYSYNLKQLFFYFNIFYNDIYFCNGKTEFSACSFFLNIKVKTFVIFYIFVKTLMHFFL